LSRAANDVNRESGNESVIGVGSSDWLGGKTLIFIHTERGILQIIFSFLLTCGKSCLSVEK
jgi:hypothetical protein